VVLDPDPALPPAVERAPARGVASLKEPVSDEVIRRAVESFFAVFSNRDADALDGLLSRSARLLDAHGGSTYSALREELRGRIRAFDAASVNAVRIDGIERFDYRDLGFEPGAHPRPGEMRPGDILVRVHVGLPRASGSKLFAPVVVLLWRWEEDVETPGKGLLRVAGYDEEEEPPSRQAAKSW
jgi:hypothetical protein